MSVILFDPNSRKGAGERPARSPNLKAPGEEEPPPQAGQKGDAEPVCGLELRIRTLEDALLDALRENAANWARAEWAERLLNRAGGQRRESGGKQD